MTAPEFTRPRRLDTIGAGEVVAEIAADPAECAALAKRFGLVALNSLTARYAIRRDASAIFANGRIDAHVTQACVATGVPLPATIAEDFALRFLPESADDTDEVELEPGELDTMFYSGGAIDLGEAAAETLALALDPFPRARDAAAALKQAGVIGEEEAGPFGALAGLKDKLAGQH